MSHQAQWHLIVSEDLTVLQASKKMGKYPKPRKVSLLYELPLWFVVAAAATIIRHVRLQTYYIK